MDTQAPIRWDVYDSACPTRRVLDRIADRWTVLLVGRLAERAHRFGELRRALRISQKVLAQALRALEREGIIARRVFATVPPAVEYSLTPLGGTLDPLLRALRIWSEMHVEAVIAAERAYDARSAKPEVSELRDDRRSSGITSAS